MKVGGSLALAWSATRVQEKSEGDAQGQNSPGQGSQSQNRGAGSEEQNASGDSTPKKDTSARAISAYVRPKVSVVDPEQVQAAMDAFSEDEQAVAAGLKVEREPGAGPGLKIIVRDGTGAVLRRFSGEEFVRLRETAGGPSLHAPGKILDRKL